MKNLLHFLITAGPTQESLDPVRYLTNKSSGKMGYALAEAALKKGHQVTLISGPVSINAPKKAKLISVTTALEMYKAVIKNYKKADVILKVAAVADYKPQKISNKKIKKNGKKLTLKLIPNPDILKTLGKIKSEKQILVGFAAETHEVEKFAQKKLKDKNCDWIVMNNVGQKNIGFNSEDNEVILFSKAGQRIKFKKTSKKILASRILDEVLNF